MRFVGRRSYYGWTLVATLGLTETISWGVLYYAFTVFVAPMQAELGWSRADISGAFSLALLLSGLAAFPVGRWLDQHGPRGLMTIGSLAAVLLVLAWSGVHSLPAFYALWAGIGLAMAAVLYQPAMYVVATWFSAKRARALSVLTLIAGWASVIFVPLASWLVRVQGWRIALVTLAAVVAAGTVLPHALLLRRRPQDLGYEVDGAPCPPEDASHRTTGRAPTRVAPIAFSGVTLRHALRRRPFWWLTIAFCLAAATDAMLSVHLVPYLADRGYTAQFAAAAAGLIGLAALLGRVAFAPLDRVEQHRVAGGIYVLQALSLLTLLLAPAPVGIFVFIVLYGGSRGAGTLVRAHLLAVSFGPAQYGAISGLVALFVVLVQALSPLLAGAAYDAIRRYDPVLWTLTALALAAAGAVWLAGRTREAALDQAAGVGSG